MKLFKDLPNTDTPINAEMLNQIQDNLVVVSATEPTGENREKVWMQKGKNLYNPKNAYVTGNLSQNIGFIYRDIKGGQTYTFSATNYSWVSVKTYNSANELIREVGNTEFSKEVTITIQDTEIYVELLFYTGLNNLTSTNSIDFTNVQFEQGSTATAYEAYIEPKMFVKNDNGVYAEFISKEDTLERYSTTEQKIGTWIDGKPLYRKVGYVGNTAISSSETTVRHIDLPTDATPISASAIFYTETSGYGLFVNSTYAEDGFKIRYMSNQHAIQVIATEDVAAEKSFSAYVIVEYTKTTD